ncbi:Uncharacterised protein [Mycobacterium tuberculosis]|nr:Uncharacterised protein [Mycobacterium tuberculosis]CKV59748.1 Uncharacterised protein [Mycobacterium tuberculosis]
MKQKSSCHCQLHSVINWFVVWQNFVSLEKLAISVQMQNHKLQLSTMKMTVRYV